MDKRPTPPTIQHVHISDYKNLKDFTLSFDNDSFLDVFVGKNGTGKSNLFEALIGDLSLIGAI